jgi:hypothetical protein
MRTFIFLIGSTDDFSSIEELVTDHNEGKLGEKNASVFKFSLNEGTGGPDLTFKDIAHLIGFGMALESNWCLDDTVSTLIEVE